MGKNLLDFFLLPKGDGELVLNSDVNALYMTFSHSGRLALLIESVCHVPDTIAEKGLRAWLVENANFVSTKMAVNHCLHRALGFFLAIYGVPPIISDPSALKGIESAVVEMMQEAEPASGQERKSTKPSPANSTPKRADGRKSKK